MEKQKNLENETENEYIWRSRASAEPTWAGVIVTAAFCIGLPVCVAISSTIKVKNIFIANADPSFHIVAKNNLHG
jgi:hypothetical protein